MPKTIEGNETKISVTSKVWAAASYLWFFCFISLILKKNNPFVLFHARQGLILFVVWLFLLVISAVPVLGHIVGFLGNVVVLVLAIMGIIHALGGEYWTMPWLGGVAADLKIGT